MQQVTMLRPYLSRGSTISRRSLASVVPNIDSVSKVSTAPSEANGLLMAAAPGIRIVDLHRPEALNAINARMVETFAPLVADWNTKDSDVKMVVVRSSEFCIHALDVSSSSRCFTNTFSTGTSPACVVGTLVVKASPFARLPSTESSLGK